jgi:hypothetical protein
MSPTRASIYTKPTSGEHMRNLPPQVVHSSTNKSHYPTIMSIIPGISPGYCPHFANIMPPTRIRQNQEFIWFNRASASFLLSSGTLGLLIAALRPPALQKSKEHVSKGCCTGFAELAVTKGKCPLTHCPRSRPGLKRTRHLRRRTRCSARRASAAWIFRTFSGC